MFIFVLSQFLIMNLGARPDAAWLSRAYHPIGRAAAQSVTGGLVIRAAIQSLLTLLLLAGMVACVYVTDMRSAAVVALAITLVSAVSLLGVAGEIATWMTLLSSRPRRQDEATRPGRGLPTGTVSE
jgi:hypothetical protein